MALILRMSTRLTESITVVIISLVITANNSVHSIRSTTPSSGLCTIEIWSLHQGWIMFAYTFLAQKVFLAEHKQFNPLSAFRKMLTFFFFFTYSPCEPLRPLTTLLHSSLSAVSRTTSGNGWPHQSTISPIHPATLVRLPNPIFWLNLEILCKVFLDWFW